jgi:hypothetical protein
MSVSSVAPSATPTTTSPFVSALRWYMRIAGILLLLFNLLGAGDQPNLFSFIANNGPYIVLALAAIVGSFGKRVNWLLAVVLTLAWGILDIIFLFGGPNGPGLIFEIPGVLLAVSGIAVALLSSRAFAKDF